MKIGYKQKKVCPKILIEEHLFLLFALNLSIPTPSKYLLSSKIDNIRHPLPTPTSKTLILSFLFVNFNTCSTIISVSGLGIKTFSFTKNSCFQKFFIYDIRDWNI